MDTSISIKFVINVTKNKSQNVRFFRFGLDNKSQKCHNQTVSKKQLTKGNKEMAVNTALYKVGDTYTSQKSKVTGSIKEIVPNQNGSVRVKLDVEGKTRWTTWKAK